jgi:superfamily 6 holin (LLH)
MTQAQTLQIIVAVLGILLPPIIGAVVLFVQQKLAQLPTTQRAQLESIAALVVKAVEQGASLVPNDQKKTMAVSQLKNIAKKLGMTVDDASASSFIEAAVYQVNQVGTIAQSQWLKPLAK